MSVLIMIYVAKNVRKTSLKANFMIHFIHTDLCKKYLCYLKTFKIKSNNTVKLFLQTFRLVGQDKQHDYLWRSLLIFGGIYLFYVSERFMKIIIDLRKVCYFFIYILSCGTQFVQIFSNKIGVANIRVSMPYKDVTRGG